MLETANPPKLPRATPQAQPALRGKGERPQRLPAADRHRAQVTDGLYGFGVGRLAHFDVPDRFPRLKHIRHNGFVRLVNVYWDAYLGP